ncbi:MAG: helicase-related protein [Polyangiales bacterium]
MTPASPDDSLRLALESWRLRHAASFAPMLAVHEARVDPLPHQLAAVYDAMLARRPLRFLLADDPGAGKTIMAGLLVAELRARGRLARCLVVAPGSLVDQWRDELAARFDLRFAAPDRDALRDPEWFARNPLVVVRLDQCARDPRLVERVAAAGWDLAIFDEAHRLSATWNGARQDPTQRRRFAAAVAARARDVLLMSATPHNGSEENFQAFLQLLDVDRFEGRYRPGVHAPRIDDVILRRLKEDLRRFDGSNLFPPRRAVTTRFALSPDEQRLYDRVTAYVRAEFDRAEAQGGARGRTVGFALTVLQRRLASSPLAIARSLQARREKLAGRLSALRSAMDVDGDEPTDDELESALDLPDADAEAEESALAEGASAARTAEELADEVARLESLEGAARALLAARVDRKREAVASLLTAPEMSPAGGRRRKLVVFTEHRDTLTYVADFLGNLRGRPECVVAIHGALDRRQRLEAQRAFTEREEVEFLVATDAAGEGINLQCASLVLNWDLPWSPARLEQRFGRVHRIGQRADCQLWNLVAEGTRETAVFDALCRRLDEESRSLGGQVFDVLGAAFDEKPLREFLLDAVRGGPRDAERLGADVDQRVAQALTRQQDFSRRTGDLADARARDLALQRDRLDVAAAMRPGPEAVGPWFRAALQALGARVFPRETGRWRANVVPDAWRAREPSLPARIACVAFDPAALAPGGDDGALVTAAHPWARSLAESVLASLPLDDVAVRVDPLAADGAPWWLVAVTQRLRTGDGDALDEHAWCVAVDDDGAAVALDGPAHLDLRPCTPAEREAAAARGWGDARVPPTLLAAVDRAVAGPWRAAVKAAHQRAVSDAQREVQSRLSSELQHATQRAAEARAKGPRAAAALQTHEREARALQGRLLERAAGFDRRREVLADPLARVAVVRVLPAGALGEVPFAVAHHARAVAAVCAAERLLGRAAADVRANRRGWDVEGRDPETGRWRAWVVRAVAPGDVVVTLRRSEALALAHAPEAVALALVEFDGEVAGVPVEVRGAVRELPPFEAREVTVRVG